MEGEFLQWMGLVLHGTTFPSACGMGSPSDTEQSQYSTGTESFQLIKTNQRIWCHFFLPTKQETY